EHWNTTGSFPNPRSDTVLFLLLSRRWRDYLNNAAATSFKLFKTYNPVAALPLSLNIRNTPQGGGYAHA
ncbi:hypothetical protein Q4R43_17745, partial [Morganella morganii]